MQAWIEIHKEELLMDWELAVNGDDPSAYTFEASDYSLGEKRLLTFGGSHEDQLLVVVHTERRLTIRIISARKATRHERGIYEQG